MPQRTPKLDPTPALARQVLELYAGELAQVQFPDLDLALLEAAREQVRDAQLEIERVEATLAQAQAALGDKLQQLNGKIERALAYARVFAQGDPVLAPRIAEIGRRKAAPEADGGEPKPRGRKKKADSASDLFGEPASDSEHAQA
jgi:TolA-binding protein